MFTPEHVHESKLCIRCGDHYDSCKKTSSTCSNKCKTLLIVSYVSRFIGKMLIIFYHPTKGIVYRRAFINFKNSIRYQNFLCR